MRRLSKSEAKRFFDAVRFFAKIEKRNDYNKLAYILAKSVFCFI